MTDPLEWYDRARCLHFDPELFFDPDTENEAVAVCSFCTVKTECLTRAIEAKEKFGVWGGLTETQRRGVGVKRSRAKCPGCRSENVQILMNRHQGCLSCGLTWPV